MSLTPQGIKIGLFTFSYYGFLILLAVILSMLLSYRRLKARHLDTRHLAPLTMVVLVAAVLGARIWYASFPPPAAIRVGITAEFYRRSLLDFFAFWQGGFALPGAVIGGMIGFLIYIFRNQLPRKPWLRAAILIIPFAIAIIIWGNFLNQENYGLPSQLPWAINIEPAFRVPGYTSLSMYHPLFLYQSLWALFTVISVVVYERKTHQDAFTVSLTGAILAFGFILLETIRIDAGFASTMRISFWAVVLLFSLMRLVFQWRNTQQNRYSENLHT